MIEAYEVALITTPLHPEPTYRLLIAFEQAGWNYRRCAACDGFHIMDRLVDNPRALRGRFPAERCPYPDARDDPRRKVQQHYAERIERGEEVAPSGWKETPA